MTATTRPAPQHTDNLLDIPPMSLPRRTKEAAILAWRTMRTGRHLLADELANGIRVGMNGGFAAALGEFNAALSAQGIDPIRGA